jgi:hypothetical protein
MVLFLGRSRTGGLEDSAERARVEELYRLLDGVDLTRFVNVEAAKSYSRRGVWIRCVAKRHVRIRGEFRSSTTGQKLAALVSSRQRRTILRLPAGDDLNLAFT